MFFEDIYVRLCPLVFKVGESAQSECSSVLMPTTEISYSGCLVPGRSEKNSCIVSSHQGLLIIEIQGELNVPQHESADGEAEFISVDSIYEAVKYGKLTFSEKDSSKVTLYIGKSQRLLGSVVKLEKPLGILRVLSAENNNEVQMVDIIEKKLLFKERPLPIM